MSNPRIMFRVTIQEWAMLQQVAATTGVPGPSEVVANLMRRELLFMARPKPGPRPKQRETASANTKEVLDGS